MSYTASEIKGYFGHGVALIDYAMVNAEMPDLRTGIPSNEAIASLAPGQFVKVGLQPEQSFDLHPEHFWVEIVERRGIRGFVGKVANDLQPGFGIDFGDLIIFCEHHIGEIERNPA